MPPQTSYREYLLKALVPVLVILFFFVSLFLYSRLAGPIPFSVNSVVNNKSDAFNVTGEGEVNVKPDIAVVRVGVEANARTAKEAQDRINTVSNAVTDAVKALGVSEEDIKTENYNIYPEYANNLPTPTRALPPEPAIMDLPADSTTSAPAAPARPDARINNYRASSNLVIKVRDLEKANSVIDAASSNGANIVGGVSFEIDDVSKAQAEAREKAIADAKQKAEQAARAGGFRLGSLLNYYEDLGGYPRPLYNEISEKMDSAAGGQSTNIQPGSNTVKVVVTLSYDLN